MAGILAWPEGSGGRNAPIAASYWIDVAPDAGAGDPRLHLFALWATACGGGDTSAPTARGPAGAAAGDRASRVFVIVLENREYGQVIGASEAPYLNRLARRGTLATHYFAISHPSLPNYLAIIGGSTFGIHTDCTSCSASGLSLPQQLGKADVDWRAYMQGMPRSCYLGGHSGDYAKKHNPFYYFPGSSRMRPRASESCREAGSGATCAAAPCRPSAGSPRTSAMTLTTALWRAATTFSPASSRRCYPSSAARASSS